MPTTPSPRRCLLAALALTLGLTGACAQALEVDNLDEPQEDAAALTCGAGGPAIVSRAQWGARAARSTRPLHTPNRITIHHTVQGAISGPAAARAVQRSHVDGNGWSDIGYHFLVDRDGTVYEGSPVDRVGAHVLRQNTGNIGVAMIGSFHQEELGEAQKRAVANLVGHLAATYSIPIDRAHIKGHGERMATECPGHNVDLDELVRLAAAGPTCTGSDAPAIPTGLDAVEVYWARLADGSYKLHAIAGARTTRVEYHVDGWKIGESTRAQGANFPDRYRFQDARRERLFEVRGYDASGAWVSRGVGLIDVTDEVGVYIRQMGPGLFEVGLERAPEGVAGLEVVVDDRFLITDEVSGLQRSTRGAVRSRFSDVSTRDFTLTTYDADGSVRGHLRRTFDLTGGAERAEAPAPPPASGPRGYAQQILDAHYADRLTLWDQTFGRFDGADPLSNVTDAAAGQAARTSCYGTAPCDRVSLKEPLLRAMRDLRTRYGMSYFVTSITGASHSSRSYHYAGRAVDIDTVDGVKIQGDSPQVRALMAACREMGAVEVFGPTNDPRGHGSHVHCAF
jgi:hypothetical protein